MTTSNSMTMAVAAARADFARKQVVWLVSLGVSEGKAARILRAGGPGAVRAGVEWAAKAVNHLAARCGSDAVSHDTVDCLLSGVGGSTGFGRERQAAVLAALGLPVPAHRSSHQLFSVLRTAREACVGSGGIPLPIRADVAVQSEFGPDFYRREVLGGAERDTLRAERRIARQQGAEAVVLLAGRFAATRLDEHRVLVEEARLLENGGVDYTSSDSPPFCGLYVSP